MSKRQEIDKQIDKLARLPVVSRVLVKLNQVAENELTSADELSEIIVRDQGLTMRLLKVANSVSYSTRSRESVSTLSKAVIILGLDGVRRLALGMSLFEHLKNAESGPVADRLWNHSLLSAITARILAERLGYQPVEEAFVAGLVHDVGKLVLLKCDREHYAPLLDPTNEADDLIKRERRHFGLSHVKAGKKLAHRWGMPAVLAEAIAEHHVNEKTLTAKHTPPLLRITAVASILSHLLEGDPGGKTLYTALAASRERYGIDAALLDGIYDQITDEFNKSVALFGVEDTICFPAAGAPSTRPDRPHEQPVDETIMLTRLQAITEALIRPGAYPELLELVLEGINATTGIERIFVLELDGDRRNLVCTNSFGCGVENSGGVFPVPVEDGSLLESCLGEREIVYVPDTSDPRLPPREQDLAIQLRVTEFALVPLLFMDRPLGLLWLDNQQGRAPMCDDQLRAVATLTNSLALAMGQRTLVPASS